MLLFIFLFYSYAHPVLQQTYAFTYDFVPGFQSGQYNILLPVIKFIHRYGNGCYGVIFIQLVYQYSVL